MGQIDSVPKVGGKAGPIVQPSPEELKRQMERARLRIQTFRLRAGTDEICASVLASWQKERGRIVKTWEALSDLARRGLIVNSREKVVRRAKVLHSVITPRARNSQQKTNAVRKLMEKVAFELFDINVVYDSVELPKLIEDILEHHGGGPDIPFGIAFEVEQTFQVDVRRFSSLVSHTSDELDKLNARREDGLSDAVLRNSEYKSENSKSPRLGALDLLDRDSDNDSAAMASKRSTNSSDTGSIPSSSTSLRKDIASEPSSRQPSPAFGISNSRSTNSLQGYYNTTSGVSNFSDGSRTVYNLLSFIPAQGMDPISRKNLTLDLLLEMRNAFLVHFAVLVFSELFDDIALVRHKYENEMDSCVDTDTCVEEESGEDSDDA